MSVTKSPFRTIPATDALIIAHGSSERPAEQEAAIRKLASRVSVFLPHWRIRGTTMKSLGEDDAAIDGLNDPLVVPFFMSNGWFTTEALPKALGEKARKERITTAFGEMKGVVRLIAEASLRGTILAGCTPQETTLVLMAHGHEQDDAAAARLEKTAKEVAALVPFAGVKVAFLERYPRVTDLDIGSGPTVCLPFFAQEAGHVRNDIPAALKGIGFKGKLLPPIGQHPVASAIISAALFCLMEPGALAL